MKKHSKFFQGRFFFFRAQKVHSWNMRSFLKKDLFTKYKKKFFLRKYKKFFQGGFFFLSVCVWGGGGGSECSLPEYEKLFLKKSIYQNIRKNFFWENIRNFFSLGPESSISQNTKKKKKKKLRKYKFFYSEFCLIFQAWDESVPSEPILYYSMFLSFTP